MQTDIACPLCGGALWETAAREHMMYRCSGGHGFSADTLLATQGDGLDNAIWQPVRLLHQRGVLLRQMAANARDQGRERSSQHFAAQADAALARADHLPRLLGVDAADLAEPTAELGTTE